MSDARILITVESPGEGAKVIKRDLDAVSDSADKATKSTNRLSESVEKTRGSYDRLDKEVKSVENSLQKVTNNSGAALTSVGRLKTAFVGIGTAVGVLAGAYALIGLSNEKARESARGIVTEIGRLVKDIEKATGAGDTLVKVFDFIKNGITGIRAGLRTIPSYFDTIAAHGKLAFYDIAKTAEKFLNKWSAGVEYMTGGLRKARTFDLTSDIGFSASEAGRLASAKSFEDHVADIL